jgi:hypothetical protein
MKTGRIALVLALAAIAIGISAPMVSAAEDPCHDPADPTYTSYDCKVTRLRERPFVVVALQDTGINPYHIDFRLPADDDMQGVPPWEYIEGYPTTAKPLNVSLGAPSYESAVSRDANLWKGVKSHQLYYFPGTKIIGGYDPGADTRYTGVLDKAGHGTGTASEIAGMIHGFDNDVNVLIVMVQGLGEPPLQWLGQQPWIDVISASWGYNFGAYFGTHENTFTKAATDAGKTVAFAAGNGISNTAIACDRATTLDSPTAGPSWVMSVGAVSPRNGQDYCWHHIPPDVSSYGLHWPAADYKSLDGEVDFGGTSCATPLTAGVVANEILQARRAVGDTVEGPHGAAALVVAPPGATLPASGPLSDGLLTHVEAEDVVMKTAQPVAFDPAQCAADPLECANTTPTTPAYFVYEGYGLVNAASRDRATQVLLGQAPMPDRSDVDEWMAAKNAISDAIWTHI